MPTLQENQRAALMGLARDLAVAPRLSLSRLLGDGPGISRYVLMHRFLPTGRSSKSEQAANFESAVISPLPSQVRITLRLLSLY